MAIRKFVFLDPTTGQYKEQTSSDSIQVADGVDAKDAVNKSQLDAVASAAASALSGQVSSLQAEIDAVEAAVAAEQTRAEAAEAGLAADIAAEETRATAAESALSASIASEQTARIAGDAAVQAAVDAEVTARGIAISGVEASITALETSLESQIAAEATARAAAITAEQSRAEQAEAGLAADIASAAAAAASALASEVTRATGVEAGLQSALDLLNGSYTTPGSVAYDIKAAKDALETELAAEQSAREAQDAVIAGQISDLSDTVAENYLSATNAINNEQNRAELAEAGLQSAITAEESARIAAISGVEAAIAAETAAREAAVAGVAADLATEVAAREAAITSVEGLISAEESARIAAVSAVASDLSAEVSRATAAESAIAADLATEVSAREAAVSGVQSNLNTEISDRQAAVSAVAGDLATEISRATAAEGVLSADLATETQARIAGDAATLADAKLYADGLSSGLKFKDSVRVALPTEYEVAPGTTYSLPSQFAAFKAYASAQGWYDLEAGDRVLLFVPGGTSVNAGIYKVAAGGITLERAPDMAVGSDASGAFVYVEDNLDTAPQSAGSSYVCANVKGNDIVGTAALSFVIFSRMENLTFEMGLEKTGMNQVRVKLNQTNPGLVADGSGLKLKVGDSGNLAIDGNGLKLTGTLVGGKMGLANDLHSHSIVGVKITSSESVGTFVKAGGAAVSQSSPDVLGLIVQKDGSDALVVTHGVVVKSAAAFAAGDTLYVEDGGGSFVSFSSVGSGKYAIPVAKKIDGTQILVQIGTAVLKA